MMKRKASGSVLQLLALMALIIMPLSQANFAPPKLAWSVSEAKSFALSKVEEANSQALLTGNGFLVPSGIGRWTTNGPRDNSGAIAITSVALDPANSSIVYAGGGIDGKIYKSSDNGVSWRLVGSLPTLTVQALLVDPSSTNTVYAGTSAQGAFKSNDGGTSWAQINNGLLGFGINSINQFAINPANTQTLFSATEFGLYKSANGGTRWDLSEGPFVCKTVVVDPNNPNVVYAGVGGPIAVIRSTNAGSTWTPVANGIPISSATLHLAIDSINTGTLFVVIASGGATSVYKSTNSGSNWSLSSAGLPSVGVFKVLIDPAKSSTIYASTSTGVYRSTDGGATWREFNDGLIGSLGIVEWVDDLVIDKLGLNLHAAASGVYDYTYSGASCTLSCAASVPGSSTTGAPVNFSGTANPSGCTGSPTYDWDFGDGTPRSTQPNPTHAYSIAGTYTWRLTVSIAGASPCVRTGTITIGSACTLSCSATVPASGTVNALVSFAATATASGCSGAPSYDWDFGDNTAHSSQQNPTHAYSAAGVFTWRMTANVAGASSCVRTGTITISAACSPPSITTQPSGQIINPGQTATLNVVTQGTAPLSYQWYRSQSGDTSNPVPGATGSSFITPPLNVTTSYWVRVSNACGSVNSNSATITISSACTKPTITNQPISPVVVPNERATLSVTAAGTTPLTYQWYEGLRGDTSRPVDGATASALRTPPITDNTRFWVRVSNQCGNVDSNPAIVFVAGSDTLSIKALDPACPRPNMFTCNGEYLRVVNGEVLPDHNPASAKDLADLSTQRDKVATDGVTLLVLQVRSASRVTFTLPFNTGRGTLISLDGTQRGRLVNADPVSTKAGPMVFAVYQAPLDYLDTDVTITATSVLGRGRKVITFERPPVVLVHGVWSSSEAWDKYQDRPMVFAVYLRNAGYSICPSCLADYSSVNHASGSFDPQASTAEDQKIIVEMNRVTRDALIAYRKQGIASTQVDVVGHSMGGLVARARVKASFPQPFYRLENFRKGEFHKIITVGTPHRGTPLANWLIKYRNNQMRHIGFGGTLEGFFSNRLFKPLGPAIYGFRTFSEALVNIGDTPVPSHAIVGVPGSYSGSEQLLDVIIKWASCDQLVSKIINDFGDPTNPNNRNVEQDTIVPVWSQRGGLTGEKMITRIEGVVHSRLPTSGDTGETESEAVWNAIVDVLKAPIDQQTFGNFTQHIPLSQPDVQCQTSSLARESLPKQLSGALSITPAPGTVVRPGDVVQINASVTGGNGVDGVLFSMGQDLKLIEGTGPFGFFFVAPANSAGRIDILAATFGPGPENYVASTYVLVRPTVPPLSLAVAPGEVFFQYLGEQLQLRVTGNFLDDGMINLTTSTAGTSYATHSGTSSVVSVSPEGLIDARGFGKETIVISNSGKTVAVDVYVSDTGVSPYSLAVSVSAASYDGFALAPEGIVAAFSVNLAAMVASATTVPLPTSLAGVEVIVRDSADTERAAPLFFVSPNQINYQIPPGSAPGAATITVQRDGLPVAVGTALIEPVAPGLFSANVSGQGVAAAVALRVKADGSQIYEPISRFDQAQNKFVAIPLDLGPATDRLFLILFGTGIRFRSSLSAVTAKIGGADAQLLYAGPVEGFVGLDQVNLSVPRSLVGRGEVDIVITADGKTANTVRVSIGPVTALTPTLTSINPNTTTAGSSAFTLTVNGTNFANGSVVRWNGNERATTFVGITQLRSAISAGDIANAGTASITVLNPNGGGVSNSLPFSITQSCAYLISPTSQSFSALGGSGSVNVTATGGCNWMASSNASWITINSGSSGSGNGTVTFSVTANSNTAQRTSTLTIAFQTFTVTQAGASNPVPAITSLTPNSVAAAGPAFSLTINGTGFVPGSVVRWNGNNRVTTYVSNTQLTAQIPASDIASAGTASITAFNPSPGGGISNASSIAINSSLRWRESGLNGEIVNSFVVSGTSIFASTRDRDFGAVLSGIHRSTDNGQNWTRVFSGLSNQNVNALTVRGTTLYAGTSGPGTSGSVYRSTDNGQNWTQINSGLPNQYVASIATGGTAVFVGMGRLLPGESGGVYKLSDSGQSWTRVFQAPPNQGVSVLAANGMNIFAGTNGIGTSGNVYRSTDGGQNWTLIFSGQRNQNVNALVVIGNLVLAGTSDFNTLNIVYRSTDNGQNWDQVASGLTNRDVRAFAALGTNIFAGSPGGGVYRSTDNGQNWTAINDGLTNLGVISLGISGTRLLAGLNGGGVFSLDIGSLVTPPPVTTQPIAVGQAISGALTLDDQVQLSVSGRTYFFDAYRFTTTQANSTVGIDMRSSQLDAEVLLYQVNDNRLNFIAADDQAGGYGDGKIENNNALLLAVLPAPGDYVIFASSSDYEPYATGSYTLKLLTNVVQPIRYGDTLNAASIAVSDLQSSAGVYLDAYWFTGAAGDNVRIKMGSTVFDSYLILQKNSGGLPIAADDNSGGGPQGRDAQISFQLPTAGIYVLLATPFEPVKTGAYSLTLDKTNSLALSATVGPTSVTRKGREPWNNDYHFLDTITSTRASDSERFANRRVITSK